MGNRIYIIDPAQAAKNALNYVESDLLDKAHAASDRIEIEQLKEHARRCCLFDTAMEIEQIWIETQKENLQLDYFDKLGSGLFGLFFTFIISLFLGL
jgi:hypothetical protein